MAQLPVVISKGEPNKSCIWLRPVTWDLLAYKPHKGWTPIHAASAADDFEEITVSEVDALFN